MRPQLFFPCVNFTVSGVVASSDGVSPIESHFLRAVEAGIDRLDEIQSVFGLRLRMAMEIVNRMLRRNLVVVDFQTGVLRLPYEVSNALRNSADLGTIYLGGTDRPEPREFRLCLNQLTGGVTNHRFLHVRSLDDGYFQVPSDGDLRSVEDIDSLAVELAVSNQLRREGLRLKELNIDTRRAQRDGGLLATGLSLEWGPGPDDASVTLEFDRRHLVSAAEATALEALLLSTRQSPDREWIWKRLAPRTVEEHAARGPMGGLLPRTFWNVAAGLRSGSATELRRGDVMTQLSDLSASLEDVGRVRLHLGAERCAAIARDCVGSATRQTVAVAPFLNASVLEDLAAARSSSTTLAVIHGIDRSVEPDAAIDGFGGSVVIDPTHGAAVHAKVLTVDGRRAIVGSKNFLSSTGSSHLFDVAVELEDRRGVAEILGWINAIAPKSILPRVRWRLDELPADAPERFHYALPSPDTLSGVVSVLEDKVRRLIDGLEGYEAIRGLVAGVRAWFYEASRQHRDDVDVSAADLARFVEGIAAEVENLGLTPYQLVTTAEHRPLLFDALGQAKRWVLVSSHRLGRHAVGPNLQRALESALRRGVDVVLCWGAPKEKTTEDDADEAHLIAALRSTASECRGELLVNDVPLDLHCKLLLVDGEMSIVTSYELLNFTTSRQYTRHELGLWLGSRRFCSELLDGLREHIAGIDPPFASRLGSICSIARTPATRRYGDDAVAAVEGDET